jgi:hypothetical protein
MGIKPDAQDYIEMKARYGDLSVNAALRTFRANLNTIERRARERRNEAQS